MIIMILIKCQPHNLICDRIQSKNHNPINPEIFKIVRYFEFWMWYEILISPYEIQLGSNHSKNILKQLMAVLKI